MKNNLSVFLSRVRTMSIKKMILMIKQIYRTTGKNPFIILTDMILCALKYNIGYQDYRVFGFAEVSQEKRKTFLTMNKNLALIRKLNDRKQCEIYKDKRLFLNAFEKYTKRDWIDLEGKTAEDLRTFCIGKESIFVKTPSSFGGQGIGEIRPYTDTNFEYLYNELKRTNQTLIEEKIPQHEKMKALHPDSLNTLRIVTLKKDNQIHIIRRILRMGQQGSVIDNITSGGIYAPVDENGIISHPAFCDKNGEIFHVHPTTKVFLPGYKIPFFDEVISLVNSIASEEEKLGYVGWDVAITPEGPTIVEGNEIPSYEILQNYVHRDGNKGLLPVIEEILGEKL